MPSDELTDLQRAMVEHDDDMARLDRNTMPTPKTTITVESALAELFKIKPLKWRNHRYDYQEFYSARGLLGEYIVIRWFDLNKHEWGEWKLKRQHEQGAYAAEQHWQEYVKQALVPVETEQ